MLVFKLCHLLLLVFFSHIAKDYPNFLGIMRGQYALKLFSCARRAPKTSSLKTLHQFEKGDYTLDEMDSDAVYGWTPSQLTACGHVSRPN